MFRCLKATAGEYEINKKDMFMQKEFELHGVSHSLSIPIEAILLCLEVCVEKCDYFCKNGKQYHRKHLHQCLRNAQESNDDEHEKEILAIIQREKDRSFWR